MSKQIIQTSIAGNIPAIDSIEYNQIAITSTDGNLHVKVKDDVNGDSIATFKPSVDSPVLTEAGVVPTAEELPDGVLGINTADGKVFVKKSDGTVAEISGAGGSSETATLIGNVIQIKGDDVVTPEEIRSTAKQNIAASNVILSDSAVNGLPSYQIVSGAFFKVDSPATDFAIGTNDFTYEVSLNANSLNNSYNSVFNTFSDSEGGIGLGIHIRDDGRVHINVQGEPTDTTQTISTLTDTDLCVERNSGTVNIFIDGVNVKSVNFARSLTVATTGMEIGRSGEYIGTRDFNGKLANIRFSNIARYNGVDYTPSTEKFVSDDNTVLLLDGSSLDDNNITIEGNTVAGEVLDTMVVADATLPSYSTEEVLTEKRWIDGKPIYRKVYASNPVDIPAGVVTNLDDTIAFETLVSAETIMDNDGDGVISYDVDNYTDIAIRNGVLTIYHTGGGDSSGNVIVEYTKTTDTATSPVASVASLTTVTAVAEQQPDIYSFDEVKTNKYYDGKPVYRRIMKIGNVDSIANNNGGWGVKSWVDLGNEAIDSPEKMVSFEVINSGQAHHNAQGTNGSWARSVVISLTVFGGSIGTDSATNLFNNSTCLLEYTKTTDVTLTTEEINNQFTAQLDFNSNNGTVDENGDIIIGAGDLV